MTVYWQQLHLGLKSVVVYVTFQGLFLAKSLLLPARLELRGRILWICAAAERSGICSLSWRFTSKQRGAISCGGFSQGGCCTGGILHFNRASLVTGTAEEDERWLHVELHWYTANLGHYLFLLPSSTCNLTVKKTTLTTLQSNISGYTKRRYHRRSPRLPPEIKPATSKINSLRFEAILPPSEKSGKQMRWSSDSQLCLLELRLRPPLTREENEWADASGREAPAGGRLPPKMRTDTGVQGLICVTGEFAYKWKMTEFFCSPQLSMSSASSRLYLPPPPNPLRPPPPLHTVWRIFITCEAGAPCLLLISTAGQWLNLLNFISGAIHFFFLPPPVRSLCSFF